MVHAVHIHVYCTTATLNTITLLVLVVLSSTYCAAVVMTMMEVLCNCRSVSRTIAVEVVLSCLVTKIDYELKISVTVECHNDGPRCCTVYVYE